MENCIDTICDITTAISAAFIAIIIGHAFVSSAINARRKRKAVEALAKTLADKLKECKCRCEKESNED